MKIVLTTCSDDRMGRKGGLYEKTQADIKSIITNSFLEIDEVRNWTIEDVFKTDFYQGNKNQLDNIDAAKNGRVYKPYAILQDLLSLNDGDFLIYADCSPEIWANTSRYMFENSKNLDVKDITMLCELNYGILSTFVKWDTRNIPQGELGIHTHENFTLNVCMETMGLEHYSKFYMHASGMMVFQKSKKTIRFVEEWLYWNTNPNCCALGYFSEKEDYSFWDKEEDLKMGCRHDQSISGLMINRDGYKLLETVPSILHSCNFLNFCRTDIDYKFIDPNQSVPTGRIKKGDTVINSKGIELKVFEIRMEEEIECLIVGKHRESCYKTTEAEITVKHR